MINGYRFSADAGTISFVEDPFLGSDSVWVLGIGGPKMISMVAVIPTSLALL
jgi:hypothetical protein